MNLDNKAWLALALTLILGACGPLVELPGGGPAPDLYTLSRPAETDQKASAPLKLMIEEPATDPALASERIARRNGPTSVQYYAGARWSDPISRLIRDHLVESFEAVPHVTALARDVLDIGPDYRLKLRLRDFNAVAGDGAPMVEIRFTALIIAARGPRIVAQRQFALKRQALGDNPRDVVTALDALFSEAGQSLIGWTLTETTAPAPEQ